MSDALSSAPPEAAPRVNSAVIVVLLLLGAAIRFALFDSLTGDTVQYNLPWFERLAQVGYRALGEPIPNLYGDTGGNYTPPYYYLLYVASRFEGIFQPIHLIKSIALAFELLAAFLMFKLVRAHPPSSRHAWLAALCVLLAPTVIANGSWWGQSDAIYASLLLGSVYCATQTRHLGVVVFFGLALSFKTQAIFLSPFLVMLALIGKLPFRYLLAVPALYALMMLPAVALGWKLRDVLAIPIQQSGRFQDLSANAPNLYVFFSSRYYGTLTIAGLILTTAVCALLALLPAWKRSPISRTTMVLAATTFVALAPFLLPKMHDRYFYSADLLAIALAFHLPRLWLVPALFQITSMMAYVAIITWRLSGQMVSWLVPVAALGNTVLVGFLVACYWSLCTRPGASLARPTRQFLLATAALVTALLAYEVGGEVYRLLEGRFCPMDGTTGLFCARQFPADLRRFGLKHWVLLGAIGTAAYAAARRVIRPYPDVRQAAGR